MRAALRVWRLAAFAAPLLCALPAAAQGPEQPDVSAAGPSDRPPLKQEQLEQLVASIALYPDELLSQVLMASTYPIEIVEADRWQKKNAGLKGDALAVALEQQSWDPSVKSLVNFPDVLGMMSEQLAWTVKLGDAFIEQQEKLMATIQSLRARAKAQGSLKSSSQQSVMTEQEGSSQVIVIESPSPTTIYVPVYDPWEVYGSWFYPEYPPYFWPLPGYVAGLGVWFGHGVVCDAAWGYAWGRTRWGRHGHIDVDVHRHARFNRHIDRNRYSRDVDRTWHGGRHTWRHDPSHRRGVSYRSQTTANRLDGARSTGTARARESLRGRAEQGRRNLSAGGSELGPRRSTLSAPRGGEYRPHSRGELGPRRSTASAPRGGEYRPRGSSELGPRRSTASAPRGEYRAPARSSSGHSRAFSGGHRGGSPRASSPRGSWGRGGAAPRGHSMGGRSHGGGGRRR